MIKLAFSQFQKTNTPQKTKINVYFPQEAISFPQEPIVFHQEPIVFHQEPISFPTGTWLSGSGGDVNIL